jgi:hypothetical protein
MGKSDARLIGMRLHSPIEMMVLFPNLHLSYAFEGPGREGRGIEKESIHSLAWTYGPSKL